MLMGSCWVWSTDLGILLGMALRSDSLEVWSLTQNKECDVTGYLRVKLQYKNRLQYMVTTQAPAVTLFPTPMAHLAQNSWTCVSTKVILDPFSIRVPGLHLSPPPIISYGPIPPPRPDL
jgi:hypothetical protein